MAKILIIDDDPVYGDMTRQRLERAGHDAQLHVGPFGATAAAADAALDLIVLDVFMPALPGPELLTIMRANNHASRAKILFCSSMDAELLAQLAVEHGAHASISKSADRGKFMELVERLVHS